MDRGTRAVMVAGNLAFTAVAVIALMLGGWNAVAVAAISALYFTGSTTVLLMAETGGLRDVLVLWIEHRTRRLELGLRFKLLIKHQARQEPDEPEFIELNPMGLSSFVAPLAPIRESGEAARVQARAWIRNLFEESTGQLNPEKVVLQSASERPGRLWVALPLGEARRHLLDSGAIVPIRNGFALNLDKLMHIGDVDRLI